MSCLLGPAHATPSPPPPPCRGPRRQLTGIWEHCVAVYKYSLWQRTVYGSLAVRPAHSTDSCMLMQAGAHRTSQAARGNAPPTTHHCYDTQHSRAQQGTAQHMTATSHSNGKQEH